jgi:hypothetical protein
VKVNATTGAQKAQTAQVDSAERSNTHSKTISTSSFTSAIGQILQPLTYFTNVLSHANRELPESQTSNQSTGQFVEVNTNFAAYSGVISIPESPSPVYNQEEEDSGSCIHITFTGYLLLPIPGSFPFSV